MPIKVRKPKAIVIALYHHDSGHKRALLKEGQHSVTYASVNAEGKLMPSSFCDRKAWDRWMRDATIYT